MNLFYSALILAIYLSLALAEIMSFFTNRGEQPVVYFLRSKEQVEIDFFLKLSNQRFVAIEVKATPVDFGLEQMHLLETLNVNIVDRWIVSTERSHDFARARVVCLDQIFDQLKHLA